MKKRLLITTLAIFILLSGCSSTVPKGTEPQITQTNKSDKNQKNSYKSAKTDIQAEIVPTSANPVETVQLEQPEANLNKKNDFSALDKLKNIKYSWWITLNKEHKPTTIPSEAKNIIQKYDGIYQGDTSKKVIYLTFDEGYENGYTPKILDTLKKDNVKAVFFVTGFFIKDNASLVKRMIAEGHLVGNHTINHLSLPSLSDAKLENELYGLEKQFTSVTGKGMKYMRPPMGEYSEKVLATAQQLGYKTVFWSFAYADYDINKQKGPDHAYKIVMDNLHNGAVILLHAVSKDNTEALDRIIKGIRSQGYEIKLLDL